MPGIHVLAVPDNAVNTLPEKVVDAVRDDPVQSDDKSTVAGDSDEEGDEGVGSDQGSEEEGSEEEEESEEESAGSEED